MVAIDEKFKMSSNESLISNSFLIHYARILILVHLNPLATSVQEA